MVPFKISNIKGMPNQFDIQLPNGKIFQSYKSLCAAVCYSHNANALVKKTKEEHPEWDGVVLGPHWDFSNTTGRYRNIFLGETRQETLAKIDSGEYLVVSDVTPYLFEGL